MSITKDTVIHSSGNSKDPASASLVFIVVYFGKWPRWFDAFLLSCNSNPSVNWLIFTDCGTPRHAPSNVRFVSSNMKEFSILASQKTKVNIPLESVKKLNDFKPAYGHIFQEYLNDYAYWGYCDIDIIWGNIRKFIAPALVANYDIITALHDSIAGHFTIIRNDETGRLLYQHKQWFQKHFSSPQYHRFDERIITEIVTEKVVRGTVTVCWSRDFLDSGVESAAHQDYYLDRWYYDSGSLYSLSATGQRLKEYMYLHFISWKPYLKCNDLTNVDRFYISYDNIHEYPSNGIAKFLNRIRRAVWGFRQRKKFNLWWRGAKPRWKKRLERWHLSARKVEIQQPH